MSERRHPEPDRTGDYLPPPAEPRFAAGDILVGRYRMVAPLGRGGMGEVWRADDLTLGQPVALKFLPAPLAADPDRLARIRKEVALARHVSHPNCCRVYDLAEHAGQPFLTMEFIDGEDLAALLRRVGRLPEEKAVEVARQLCLGLAAVHGQGLLRRDLKPANVMLDGRGTVRLADFGLAAAAEDLSAADRRAGTPAYMAPEQLAGQAVTVRSDLFALGLVLYELLTGRKAFAGTDRETPPSKPSGHVSGLDAAVERIILRCLERDPAARPRSALAVAAALPGGDPLAAALAAGETPSPKLVADAGGEGAIRPWVGLVLLSVLVGSLVLVALLADRTMLFRKVPLPEPPEFLARRARQVLEHCGYADPPADTAYHFCTDAEYLVGTMHEDASPRRWDRLATARPAALYFFYRQSPQPLVPTVIESGDIQDILVTESNPPPTLPGMAGIHLAPNDWLLRLYAVPAPWSEAPPTPAAVSWSRWFDPATIGFDLGKDLTEVPPQWTPPCACDRQAAWSGTLPDCPDVLVRVEAAAYRGRPVYFQVLPVWRDPVRSYRPPPSASGPMGPFFWGLPVIVVLAIRNLRRGRGDLRGALRLRLAIVTVMAGAWLIGGRHTLAQEMSQATLVLGLWGVNALLYGLIYLAIEPAFIGLQAFVLARFGLLAFAGALFCDGQLPLAPLTADLSAWYAYQGVLMVLVVIGLAVYAFVTATRGQRLFGAGFFGDE